MIRIGHLIKGLGRGGAETLLPHVVRASADTQTSHVAYFLPWKDALVDELAAAGASVTCIGARSAAEMLLRLGAVRRWMRSRRLQVLHCHLPLSGVVGRLAAHGTGIPVVYTEHNVQERYRLATRWLNRMTWSLQERVVAVSGEVARSIERRLPGSVPVVVVPNGIPDLASAGDGNRGSEMRRCLGLDSRPVVGTVAVFRRQKRLDLWVEVARRVAAGTPEARFLIVGDGPLRPELEGWVDDAGLGDSVLMPGLQRDVVDWLQCMDVFLMTSEFEGLPLALLEAMVAGTPVVATAVGGIPEVIEDGVDGFLVPFEGTDTGARIVVELLQNPERRAEVARAARETVRDRYGVARMVEDLERIYCGMLGGGNTGNGDKG